ncbi:hypothetical protein ABZ883_04605 [Streptomyces sp. NPDC046977]|uniref:hypothetical protein n=1 Tax=Streptomyces sp. NPDC046977 TaxID=3154703 RepID=UPI0033F99EE7
MIKNRRKLRKFAISLAEAAVIGAATAGIWRLRGSDGPSLWAMFAVLEGYGLVKTIALVIHLRRKFKRVVAAYGRPAFGQGIETPHRPPADD